jgi:HEAT repeat protein
MALSEAASPAVVPPLVRMIQSPKEDAEVVRACVQGLGRSGDPAAAQPLFQLMQDRADMRQSVLDALAKSTAAPQLGTLLKQATDTETKRDLVRLLRKTYDARSADALAGLIQDPDEDTRTEAAHGLADLGDARAVEPLLALARSTDEETGSDAIDALRRLRNPAAADGLLALLEEQPYRKAAIMRALGATGAVQACALLQKELTGDDIGAAAKALGDLPCDKSYGALVAILPRSKYKDIDFTTPSVPSEMAYRNRLEAMMGLQYFGRAEGKVVAELMKIIEDPEDDFRLQTVAGLTIGQIADAATYTAVLQKIGDANLPEPVRANYVQGLWQRPNAEVSTALVPLLNASTPPAIRRAAALAIGYAGNPANDAALLGLLDDAGVRREAVLAVVLGGDETGARKLVEVLPKDRDAEDILRMTVNSNDSDDFNLLMAPMFEGGQVYRRLRVAEILRQGSEDVSFGYVWAHMMTRLRTGWDGPGGVSERYVREALYKELTGADPGRRRLMAETLASMNLRGLLLAARDAGVAEARQVLLDMDRPRNPAVR